MQFEYGDKYDETDETGEVRDLEDYANIFIKSDVSRYVVFMMIAVSQASIPIFLLEYWMRPRGFGGQGWYEWAWHYISYGHSVFWGIPLAGLTAQIAGQDAMKGAVAAYIEILSIPELTAMGTVGALLLRASS